MEDKHDGTVPCQVYTLNNKINWPCQSEILLR